MVRPGPMFVIVFLRHRMKREDKLSLDSFPNKRSREDTDDCYAVSDIQKPFLSFGRRGSTTCPLFNPVGLTIHPSNGLIFIGENTYLSTLPNIHIFSCEGEHITSFGKGKLTSICDIAIDENNIYVSNPSLHAIVNFTDFHVKNEIFPHYTTPFPTGIMCDTEGNLYLVDSHNKSVLVCNSDLSSVNNVDLITNAIPIRLNFLSDIMVIFCINPTTILYCTLEGQNLRVLSHFDDFLSHGRHFCVDIRTNNTFMSDQNQNRIIVFDIEGKLIKVILPIRNDLCVTPTSLAITPHDKLVVITPHGSSIIQLYNIDA